MKNIVMYKKYFEMILSLVIVFAGCSNDDQLNNEEVDALVEEKVNTGCEVMENGNISLIGTTWKLAGIFDERKGTLSSIEPTDCEDCYTLWFDTDSTVSIISISSRYKLNLYDLNPQIFMDMVLRCERYDKDDESYCDANLFRLFILNTESYSVTCDELKLYFVRGEHFYDGSYLSFIPHDGNNPSTSLRGTHWKLTGVVDVQTGNLTELEPKECESCYRLNFVGEYDVFVRSITAMHTYNLLNFSVYNPFLPSFYNLETDSIEQWMVDYPVHGLGDGKLYEDSRLFRWGVLNAKSFEMTHNELRIFFGYLEKQYYLTFECIFQ